MNCHTPTGAALSFKKLLKLAGEPEKIREHEEVAVECAVGADERLHAARIHVVAAPAQDDDLAGLGIEVLGCGLGYPVEEVGVDGQPNTVDSVSKRIWPNQRRSLLLMALVAGTNDALRDIEANVKDTRFLGVGGLHRRTIAAEDNDAVDEVLERVRELI